MNLERLLKNAKEIPLETGASLICKYNQLYETHPKITNYISTAIGTMGGDIIAKKFIQGEEIKLRDLLFTAGASLYQSFLHPEIIKWNDKLFSNKKVLNYLKKRGINKKIAKTVGMTAMFVPANILYWGVLSAKNQVPFDTKTILEGLESMAKVSIPYGIVDYQIANKEKFKKYALPIWTGTELFVNTYYAFKNLLLRK